MATQHRTAGRIDHDHPDVRGVLLAVAYAGGILATVAVATGAAALLSSFTTGLGQFMLVAAGWLAVVSASPEISERATERLAELEVARRAPRSTRAVNAVVTYLIAK